MTIEPGSPHHRILARLCGMPPPVRGMSEAMLNREFNAPAALAALAKAGLIRARGWHNGPGSIWVPTPEGEELCRRLSGGAE